MKYAIIPLLSFTFLPAAQELHESGTYQSAQRFHLPQKPLIVAYNNDDSPPLIAFTDAENIYTFNPESGETVLSQKAKKKSIEYPFYFRGEVVYDSQNTSYDPSQNLVKLSDQSTADLTALCSFSQIRETGIIIVDPPVKTTHEIDPLLKELKCQQCRQKKTPLESFYLKPLRDRKLLFKGDICSECVTAIAYCPAKQFLAVAHKKSNYFIKGTDYWVRVMSINNNQLKVIKMISFSSPILSMTFTASGDKLLIGLENKEMHEYHFDPHTWFDKIKPLFISVIFLIGISQFFK